MMRRVRLNMYRAEDEMFIIRKRQVGGGWRTKTITILTITFLALFV